MDASPSQSDGIAVWDIVRVDYPSADEARTRRRPALVVATPAVSDEFAILWMLMITSAPQGTWPHDVSVSDLRLGGLDHPCVVRTSKITTLDARLAVRIGELARSDRALVREALRQVLRRAVLG